MGYPKGFLHRKMNLLSGYFWLLLSKLLQTLFWVFTKIFTRYYSPEALNKACSSDFPHQSESNSSDPKTEFSENHQSKSNNSNESDQIDVNSCLQEAGSLMEESSEKIVDDNGNSSPEEEETTKLIFKFQNQTWNCDDYSEELKGISVESCDFLERDIVSASTTKNKYEFSSGNSFSYFLNEPEPSNLTVKELYVNSNDNLQLQNQAIDDPRFSFVGKVMPESCDINQTNTINAETLENSTESIAQPLKQVANNFPFEDDFMCSSYDSEDSMSSMKDGFLSDTDFGTNIELDTLDIHDGEKNTLENLDDNGYEADDFAEEDEDITDELRKLEEESFSKEKNSGNSFQDSTNSNSESVTSVDVEDCNRFDTLWEHQDLIEQLKMELKKVRATGLPTILEDSESPRIMEDLKPWKIDEKLQNGGGSTTNELPKFYRSYRERMRKLDILNYQKMYALGFLQPKDTLQSFSTLKNSSPAITSILQHGFCLSRRKNNKADPMKKFIRELYSDFEMVYVGQLCLSWEFLQWEYEKSIKLWESDRYNLRRFNEVAGEFQQFQVLLQRFIENEPFQGPRVENYARNRCVMRNLLQVPVIREDNTKDKKKFRKREVDQDAITSDMLVEILEESIRTMWRFIRADKEASNLTHKGREYQVELQDPADSELLVEIRKDLQKKEKRLRNILRSESCILKKFKKHDEDGTDPVLYFFSQVDMKLVWRVLNMSRITTEQLAWCRSKLNKISFVNRRIHVESSFLLFPSLY